MNESDLEAEIRRLHAQSFGWAMSCCGRSRADAEDVLQNAYIAVLQQHTTFDGRSSFRTWLFGVIRNTARDHRRRVSRNDARAAPMPADDRLPSGSPGALAGLEKQELAGRLAAALERLPQRQHEVLHLVFYQEMSIAEAAGVMRVSVGSARTHYDRGKRRLRALLAEDERQ
jgi:RNA polymerase sigma-70 factor (ECF subfamily)